MSPTSTPLNHAPTAFRKGVNVFVIGAIAFTLMACDQNIDRRDDRQDCRQEEGIVGGDKRDCKQDERTERLS